MAEKKPIKRHPNLVPLSREHHFSLLFVWKIRQGIKKEVDPDRMRKYVDYFQDAHLIPHFAAEEKELFQDQSDEKVVRACLEHRALEKALSEIRDRTHALTHQMLSDLANNLETHVRYEERILFPHIESKLSEAELTRLGPILRHEEKLEDNFEDEFWK